MIIRLTSLLVVAMVFSLHAQPEEAPCTFKPGPCTEVFGKCILTADCTESLHHEGIEEGDTHEGICLHRSPHNAELVCKDYV